MSPTFPVSILDTDLYKLTMGQAVLHHFPDVQVSYKFKNRSRDMTFTAESIAWIKDAIERLSNLKLDPDERTWLENNCPYLTHTYLDFLAKYRFQPQQISLKFTPVEDNPKRGHLDIDIVGPWKETIMWEVPLMAAISEAYYQTVDRDWDYQGQTEQAYRKAEQLFSAGCSLSEFGTRRRRSYQAQLDVIKGIVEASNKIVAGGTTGKLAGTSNVHFARLYNLAPIGTIAHEWTMGIAALRGLEGVNAVALQLWEEVYPLTNGNSIHIALTDTFSSDVFFRDFDAGRAKAWRGLRQDSGDPKKYAPRACEVYKSLGVDPQEKMIIFSDGLDVVKCLELQRLCDELGIKASFGVGTSLTNDFNNKVTGERSKPMNIVIKLNSADGAPCVKLSDELSKNTGDEEAVRLAKERLGLPTK